MIDLNEVQSVLQKHFGDLVPDTAIREVAEEIISLEAGWEPLAVPPEEMGFSMAVNCPDICFLADQVYKGESIRFFRKRRDKGAQAE